MNFSVLMSVYAKEQPLYLRESLNSIFAQTLLPTEVVLVEDGPLTEELNRVVDEFTKKHDIIKVIRLQYNQGLGKALSIGCENCSFDYIARMDSDDICFPNRFEKQIGFLEKHSDIDVLGSWTQEFTLNEKGEKRYNALKKFPVSVWENVKFALSRCPVEHPAVIIKKSSLIEAGGYKSFYLFEDYYLWARMFVKGFKFSNLPEPLLYFRMSIDSFRRRGGWKYAMSEARALRQFKEIGFLSMGEYIKNILIRFPIRIMPNFIRENIYNRFLRRY